LTFPSAGAKQLSDLARRVVEHVSEPDHCAVLAGRARLPREGGAVVSSGAAAGTTSPSIDLARIFGRCPSIAG